ncbi:MAG: hypothetical protein KJO36_03575, partial [Acidimicrobiia bacterium]|nr:hypothetical protein [Acidimicrobiia bacterium]
MTDFNHEIVSDLVQEVTTRTIGRRTIELVRGYFIHALVDGEPSERAQLALDQSDVPQEGDAHPELATLHVHERQCRAAGPNQFFVTVFYRAPVDEFVSIIPNRGGGVLDTQLSSVDKDDVLIETTLGGEVQDHQIPVLRPKLDLEYVVYTYFDKPWTVAADAIGKINETAFDLAAPRDTVETWLLMAMDFEIYQEFATTGEDIPAGSFKLGIDQLWRFRYVFRYDAAGWAKRVYH